MKSWSDDLGLHDIKLPVLPLVADLLAQLAVKLGASICRLLTPFQVLLPDGVVERLLLVALVLQLLHQALVLHGGLKLDLKIEVGPCLLDLNLALLLDQQRVLAHQGRRFVTIHLFQLPVKLFLEPVTLNLHQQVLA